METGEHLAAKAARDLATSSKSSATAAGPAERPPPPAELIDAINQIFALFRINYHNQFYSAFADTGLPPPRAAYREACTAPSPKDAHPWSHPAVYHAGRALGWDRLRNAPERDSWPEFQQCYRDWCRRALSGETLALPQAQEPSPTTPVDRAEGHRRLQELRRELDA